MKSSVRCLVLLSGCYLASACSDKEPTGSSAARGVTPAKLEAKAEPAPEHTQVPALTAAAPAQPRSLVDALGEPKQPAAAEPSAELPTHDDEPSDEPVVDFDRALTPEEVKIDRFVLATDVVDREPVGESETFGAETEKIFAFVQLANGEGAPYAVNVHFEAAEGPAFPYGIKLTVPTSARYRTWAFSRIKREPGRYRAVLRTLTGEEIASREFVIAPSEPPLAPSEPQLAPLDE